MISERRTSYLLLATAFAAVGSAGCGDSSSTGPDPRGASRLSLQAFQTATQFEQMDVRVQVRARVSEGSGSLSQAALSGTARARICLDGSCVEGPLAPDWGEAHCAGAAPTTQIAWTHLGFGRAWVSNDVVGFDFCVRDLGSHGTFQLTVSDGRRWSNKVRTACAASGDLLFCGSD